MTTTTLDRKPCPRAFSLAEVTLAMGIAAVSMVTLLGLLPLGLSNNKASTEQTAAAGILATLISTLRAMPNNQYNNVICPAYGFYIPALTTPGVPQIHTLYLHEDGSLAGQPDKVADPSANPRYRVTLNFYPPTAGNGSDARAATVLRLVITWPAIAEQNNYVPPPNYANSLEVVTTLDRN